jgi:hypothetical protein
VTGSRVVPQTGRITSEGALVTDDRPAIDEQLETTDRAAVLAFIERHIDHGFLVYISVRKRDDEFVVAAMTNRIGVVTH